MNLKLAAMITTGSLLAAASGVGATFALGQEPGAGNVRTVTVQVQGPPGETGATGPKGDAGATGPQGPAGLACPAGYSEGVLVLNAPGGQTRLWTCLAD